MIEQMNILNICFFVLFTITLIIGATIDWKHYILPDEGAIVLVIGALLFIATNWISLSKEYIFYRLVGSACTGAFFYLLRYVSHNGLGLGDIKWSMAIALWLSPNAIIGMLYIAFLGGALVGVLLAWKRKKTFLFIPFGPFLNGGAWCAYVLFDNYKLFSLLP